MINEPVSFKYNMKTRFPLKEVLGVKGVRAARARARRGPLSHRGPLSKEKCVYSWMLLLCVVAQRVAGLSFGQCFDDGRLPKLYPAHAGALETIAITTSLEKYSLLARPLQSLVCNLFRLAEVSVEMM